jgi:hypothetical protein
MASLNMEHFVWNDKTTLRDWSRWIMKFEALLTIQKIKFREANCTLAVEYLITLCGDRIVDLIETLDNKDTIDYITLKPLITARFAETNKRFNLFLFRSAKQNSTEHFEDFIVRLRMLAADAGVTNEQMDDELLNVIPIGALDAKVKAQALNVATTKVADLLKWFKSYDLVEKLENQIDLEQTSNKAAANVVNNNKNIQKKSIGSRKCFRCGGPYPHEKDCPASKANCNYCNQPGHFEKCCKTKRRKQSPNAQHNNKSQSNYQRNRQRPQARRLLKEDEVEELLELRARFQTESANRLNRQSDSSDESQSLEQNTYFYARTISTTKNSSPRGTIMVNGCPIEHIIDTGATMNVMSGIDFRRMQYHPKLYKSHARIYAFGATKPMPTLGEFITTLSYNNNETTVKYVVVDDSKFKVENLLSYNASAVLKIVKIELSKDDKH